MPVINANHTGATKTTMFGQPAYPGYPGNNEGVAHSQPPSGDLQGLVGASGSTHIGYDHSVLFEPSNEGTATAQPPSSASNSGVTITQSPGATGANELPSWIASDLISGKTSSWTNSAGQTFYAPNAIGQGNTLWVSGPGYSGPANGVVQITGNTTKITEGGKTIYSGATNNAPSLQYSAKGAFEGIASPSTPVSASPSGASTAQKASGSGIPLVDYHTFGTNADISFPDSHSPNFTVKVTLPNGQTFTYSGSTEGVPLGTINAKDQAVDQAWNAYLNAQSSLQNVPAGSSITVTQGTNGLDLNINAAPGTSLPTQTITIASGLTMTEPTPTASAYAAANLLGTSGFVNSLDPGKTYTSNGITFTGSQLQNMYENYESQISTTLTQDNPSVTVGEETANFNSLTPAQQQQYVQQQTDQYLQNLQYNGAGYYNINGKSSFISNPDYYSMMLGNGTIGIYEGTTAPQAPVTTPTFTTTATGSPVIELPQGWTTGSNGNLYVNGNAPTLQQSEQYAKAYADYLNVYEANQINNPTPQASSTNTETTPPPALPNWYSTLLTAPSGAVSAADLAAFQYAPLAATNSFDAYAQSLGLTPAALTAIEEQKPNVSLNQQIANAYGLTPEHSIMPSQGVASAASVPGAYDMTNGAGNTPLALSTPGTAGQSLMPQTAQNNQGYTVGMLGLSTLPQLGTNINTVQASSNNAPWYTYIPGYVASTFGSLISPITTIFNPGTPGGRPTAGGQFPYNYPITQSDINKLALTNPGLAQGIQSQYNQLRLLSGNAYPITMPNAAYTYLGSPSPTGPIFPNINPAALQYATPEQYKALEANYNLAALEGLTAAASGPYMAAVGPATAAAYGLTGAGISGVANPLLTYAFSGGKATPQQLAQSSAQGIVYGGLAGSLIPGVESGVSSLVPSATGALGRAASGALTNLAFSNAYNLLANGQPAGPWQDIFSAGLGAAVGYVGGMFKPTLAGPTDYQTVLGVSPEAENIGVTFNPEVSEATTGAENGPNAQLLKGSSYTQVTQKVYPNLISRLLGRTATYQYMIPNLPEDLIQAGSEGIGTTEALSAPLYVRGPNGVWNYVTDIKIDPQVAISKFSDALKANYNIANPEEASTETLPELYKAMQEAAEGKGIPFEGKIYQLDDFIKAIQGRTLENSNLPAIIGKDGEPLTPKEVTQLIFDLKAKPPTDFIGTMWQGIVDKNPAIISEGTIYSQPSLFQRLLGNTQQNPQATFRILTLYLQRAAAEDSDIPADEAATVAQDAALKLTNNMIALQKAVNSYLTSGAAPNMLTAGSAMPLLTAGMNELEARLFSDLVSQGFLDPQGNHVSNPSPAPTSGGTQAGNEGYIYIQNPDGTVTIQKVIQNPKEEQGEKELTKEEQQEAEKEENKQMQNEEEGQEQQTQITEPGVEEGVQITEPGIEKGTQVTEPGTSEVQITEPGQEGKEGTGLIDLEGQKEGTKGENKAATTDQGAEAQEGSTAEKEMQGQPIRVISKTAAAQKAIPVEIEKEAEKEAEQTTTPPPPPIGQKFKEVEPIVPKPNMFTAEYNIKNPQAPAYTSVYNPSLYTILFPNSNAEAEANYNPLFPALSQRPFQNPVTMNPTTTTTSSASIPETTTTTTSTPEATTTTPQYAPTSSYDYISPQALMSIGNALPSHGTPQEQQVVNNVNTALQSDQLKQGISNYFSARYPQMGFTYPTSVAKPTVEQYFNSNPTYGTQFMNTAMPALRERLMANPSLLPSTRLTGTTSLTGTTGLSSLGTAGSTTLASPSEATLINNYLNSLSPANAFSMLYGNAGLSQPISNYMQQLGAQNVMNALMNANRGYSTAEINGLLSNPNYFTSLMGNPAFANMYAPGLSNGYFGNPNLSPQGSLQAMASQLYNNGYIMTPQNTPAWYAEELAQIGAITPEEANYLLSGTEGEPIPGYIGPVQLSEPEATTRRKKIGIKV